MDLFHKLKRNRRGPWRRACLVGIAALCACVPGCKPNTSARDTGAELADGARGHRQLSVLLISMDTTRPDYLACYGHPYIRTPNIDRLAAEGTLFEQCTTAAPLTAVSHATMFTGTDPPVHGVRDNGTYLLHEGNETIAEVLRDAGYHTAAQVAALVLNREFGLNQGFEVYEDTYDTTETPEQAAARHGTYRRGAEICEHTLALLRAHRDESFFIFAHFFDPHNPYEPPEPFLNQYEERYIGEIAYVDAQIGRLMKGVDDLGLRDNTLVVLTGDHGESRWQHGEETHAAFVYDATVAIPLIMRCPELIPAGQRIGAQVRLVDVAPTLLDYLGVEGLSDAQGVTLRPLITGAETDLNLAAYSETFYTRNSFGFSILRAYRQDGWKYIHAPQPELYDVRQDPDETRNVIDAHPDRAERMREDLRTFLAESPKIGRSGGQRPTLSDDALAELQGLGYVGGTAPGGQNDGEVDELSIFEPRGADPKDYVELLTLVSQALGHVQAEHPDAEKKLLQCIEGAPDPDAGFGWAFIALANILAKQDRYEEAIDWYKRALTVDPDDSRTLTALGETLSRLNRTDDALVALRAALQLEPVLAHTYLALGRVLATKGEHEEAIAQLRKALEIDANSAPAHRSLARLFVLRGQTDEVKAAYRRALEISPDNALWRQEFADLLLVAQEPEAALAQYEQWAKLEPDKALAHAGIADALCVLQRTDEALTHYRRAFELDPTRVTACDAYGQLLLQTGATREAAVVLRTGLEASPTHANLANNLAWLLATSPDGALRDGAEAVKWAEVACEQTERRNPNYLDTLAAAYAEAGRYPDAIKVLEGVIKTAVETGHAPFLEQTQAHLAVYRSGRPWRSP